MKFRVQNVYQRVFLASLASLMKTAFPCTIFIGQAMLRLLVLLEGDYIAIAR